MSIRDRFEDHIFFATLRLEVMDLVAGISSRGTGFLVNVPISDERQVVLLVSNRHVFSDPSRVIRLTFHKRASDSSEPELGQSVVVGPARFAPAYFPHPNPAIDLACINIAGILQDHPEIYYRGVVPDMFATYTEDALSAGRQVLFIGYPNDRYDQVNNLPIIRSGILASFPDADFEGVPQVVIDAQVFPGSSGSPVFMALGSAYKLIGVVVQTMIRHERLVTMETAAQHFSQEVLGLGLVYKSTALRELIDTVLKAHKLEETPGS